MRRLLRAENKRMVKNILFWVALGVSFALGLMAGNTVSGEFKYGYEVDLADSLFAYTSFSAFIAAVFVPMFFGTEFMDGTIRNKLIAGHGRSAIYLSKLVCSYLMVLSAAVSYVLGYLVLTVPVLGRSAVPGDILLKYAGISLLTLLAFSALFTKIAMLVPNKAASVVVSMLFILGMLIVFYTLENRLDAGEFHTVYSMGADGEEVPHEEPNPHYLEPGLKRDVYEFVVEFLPMGQAIMVGPCISR